MCMCLNIITPIYYYGTLVLCAFRARVAIMSSTRPCFVCGHNGLCVCVRVANQIQHATDRRSSARNFSTKQRARVEEQSVRQSMTIAQPPSPFTTKEKSTREKKERST